MYTVGHSPHFCHHRSFVWGPSWRPQVASECAGKPSAHVHESLGAHTHPWPHTAHLLKPMNDPDVCAMALPEQGHRLRLWGAPVFMITVLRRATPQYPRSLMPPCPGLLRLRGWLESRDSEVLPGCDMACLAWGGCGAPPPLLLLLLCCHPAAQSRPPLPLEPRFRSIDPLH